MQTSFSKRVGVVFFATKKRAKIVVDGKHVTTGHCNQLKMQDGCQATDLRSCEHVEFVIVGGPVIRTGVVGVVLALVIILNGY